MIDLSSNSLADMYLVCTNIQALSHPYSAAQDDSLRRQIDHLIDLSTILSKVPQQQPLSSINHSDWITIVNNIKQISIDLVSPQTVVLTQEIKKIIRNSISDRPNMNSDLMRIINERKKNIMQSLFLNTHESTQPPSYESVLASAHDAQNQLDINKKKNLQLFTVATVFTLSIVSFATFISLKKKGIL